MLNFVRNEFILLPRPISMGKYLLIIIAIPRVIKVDVQLTNIVYKYGYKANVLMYA